MLDNIKKTKNIVVPFAPYNDSSEIQEAGILIWTGWVLVYPSVSETDSLLKKIYNNFELISVPVGSIK